MNVKTNNTNVFLIVALLILPLTYFRLIWQFNTPLHLWWYAGHDDGLFLKLAKSIATGHWLGEYDQMTLAKGPGYPIFLALSAISGLPVTVTHALFSVLAILVTACAIRRITGSNTLSVITFLLCILLPSAFDPLLQRFLRDQIYWGQTLLILSTFSVAILAPPKRFVYRLVLAALSGLLLGWTWLTREEGVWLIPGIAIIILGQLVKNKSEKQPLRWVVAASVVCSAGFGTVYTGLLIANRISYDKFIATDIKERHFNAVIGILQNIDYGDPVAFVPVTNEVLRKAAEVSPAFQPIATAILPGGALHMWSDPGCKYYDTTCGQIAGGWFIWALRDAAAAKGFYASPATASREFAKIADELQQACRDGRLKCRAKLFDLMPPMSADQWRSLPRIIGGLLQEISFLKTPNVVALPREDLRDVSAFNSYWQFLNFPKVAFPLLAKTGVAVTSGWMYDKANPGEWATFRVEDAAATDTTKTIARNPSPDIANAFRDPVANRNRFVIEHSCKSDCILVATEKDGRQARLPIPFGQIANIEQGSITLYVDSNKERVETGPMPDLRSNAAANISNAFYAIYKIGYPPLLVVGFISLLFALLRSFRRRRLSSALILASAAWALVCSRIMLVALIAASSFPAANMIYAAPIPFLAGIAAVLSIFTIRFFEGDPPAADR